MKYRLATQDERATYYGVYPLHAIITNAKNAPGLTFCVEDLRCWGSGDPQWELMAPDGYHFDGHGTHSVLEHTIKDIKDQARYASFEACSKETCNP
jgi:hypothetical protein